MLRRKRVKNHAAANRNLWRVRTKNEAIAEHAHDRSLSSELNETTLAGFDLTAFRQHAHARQNLRRADVNPHALPRTQRPRRIFKQIDSCVDRLRWPQPSNWSQHHAPFDSGSIHPAQVDG